MNWELIEQNRRRTNRLFKLLDLWNIAFKKYQGDPERRMKVISKINKMQSNLFKDV